jgi:ribosomal protein S21
MIIINCKNKKLESLLKEYRQKVERIGQTQELRDRQTHEKPSEKRRRIKKLAQYRNRKNENS